MGRDDLHPEHIALRDAFNAMVMFSFDGLPLYRTHNDIGMAMPPSVERQVMRVLRPARDVSTTEETGR